MSKVFRMLVFTYYCPNTRLHSHAVLNKKQIHTIYVDRLWRVAVIPRAAVPEGAEGISVGAGGHQTAVREKNAGWYLHLLMADTNL